MVGSSLMEAYNSYRISVAFSIPIYLPTPLMGNRRNDIYMCVFTTSCRSTEIHIDPSFPSLSLWNITIPERQRYFPDLHIQCLSLQIKVNLCIRLKSKVADIIKIHVTIKNILEKQLQYAILPKMARRAACQT